MHSLIQVFVIMRSWQVFAHPDGIMVALGTGMPGITWLYPLSDEMKPRHTTAYMGYV